MQFRRFSLVIVSSLIGCTIALLLAEATLRLVGVRSKLVYTPNPYYGWSYAPADEFRWTTESRELEIRINQRGLRDRDYPYEKPNDVVRVLVLGDSFVEALQVRLEDSFAKVLETKLNEDAVRPRSKRVEVINAGVSGFGTDNELLFFTHEGYKYEPDIVLLAFYVGNDVRNNWHPLEEQDSGGPRKPTYEIGADGLKLQRYPFAEHATWTTRTKVFLNRHSVLYAFVRELRDRWARAATESASMQPSAEPGPMPLDLQLFQRQPTQEWDKAWEVTSALLGELNAESSKRRAQLFVVTVPTAFQVQSEIWERRLADNGALGGVAWSLDTPNETLSQICAEHGIPQLDLLPLLRSDAATGASLYLLQDNHWNEAGHEVAAGHVANVLAPLLDKP